MSTNTYRDLDEAIGDLLACAYAFDDKPHKLFSAIARIANQYGDADDAPEIDRLMMRAYEHIGAASQVWSDEEPQTNESTTTTCATWPGDEADEELQTQLAGLNGEGSFDPAAWGFVQCRGYRAWVYRGEGLSRWRTILRAPQEPEECTIHGAGARIYYRGAWPPTAADGDTLMRLLGFERVSPDDATTTNETKD